MLIAQAPLRVSLFGGGSDLPAYLQHHNGAVLSFAIDRRVYLIGHPFTHRSGVLLKYSKTEDVASSAELEHPIAREVFTRYAIENMDVAVMADVPAGTGMGSSSSFTVGCIVFASALRKLNKSPRDLAVEACEIEIETLREPIGMQDQWASALGGINVLEFSNDEVLHRPIYLDTTVRRQLESNIFLVPVGGSRSASDLLTHQIKELSSDPKTVKLTRQIVSLVPQGERAMTHNLDDLGPLLDNAWRLKRELTSGVSNDEVDSLYSTGIKAGATGGKLLGAGSSGYLAFYVPETSHEKFSATVKERLSFGIAHQGAGIIHES